MRLAKYSFLMLQYCGFWRPRNWSNWKILIYNIYTLLMFLTLSLMALSQIIELLKTVNDITSFVNDGLVALTTINSCTKSANILLKKNDILKLNKRLQTNPCSPRTSDELKIQKKFDDKIKSVLVVYSSITAVGISIFTAHSVIADTPEYILPFVAWFPYNIQQGISYWATFILQHFADLLGAAVTLACDSLISGCMLQTCAQIEIFQWRLTELCRTRLVWSEKKSSKQIIDISSLQDNQIIQEKSILTECIQHHLYFLDFAESSNNIFAFTIFLQFSTSSIVICACIYGLTRVPVLSGEFISIMVYFTCMLVQIFIYCLYGQVVTGHSMDMCDRLHQMNWLSLSAPAQKCLLTIMIRTSKPIQFTSGHIVILSLDSFNKLLKMSYSAYSVLKQMA